jgi:hypothetical protein
VNSERIKARFGSYHVRVLHQDESRRLANLCSSHDHADVCRTLAVTCFATPTPSTLTEADALIRQGHSIGSTLKQAKQQISREMIAEASVPCGDAFAALTGHTVCAGDLLYLRLYRLNAGEPGGDLAPYATIAEAHHPEHTAPGTEASSIAELSNNMWSEDAHSALATLLAAL